MKIKAILMSVAVLCLASCSDSKDENVAGEIASSYEGYTVASSKYFENQVAPNQKVVITGVTDNQVNVSWESETWGTISISNSSVSFADNTYSIVGTGTSQMGMQGGTTKEYECQLAGTISHGTADLLFTCPAVMGGLKIAFKQGEIPAGIVVPGTYKGYSKASFQYSPTPMLTDGESLKIETGNDGKYSVTYSSTTWGDFTISDATVTCENNLFKISGKGSTYMGMGENKKDYACEFEGSIDVSKENYTFKFTVPSVMGGLVIDILPGSAPANE